MSLFVKSFILDSSFHYTVNFYRYIRRTCQCNGASLCLIAIIVYLFFQAVRSYLFAASLNLAGVR